MKKIVYYFLCALSFGISAQAAPPDAQLPKKHLQLFKTYCYECHDSLMEEGDINLEELTFNISKDMKTAETWQKVLNAINSGEMPPEDEKQIKDEEKIVFLDDLANQMVTARKVLSDTGSEITMRRLNRREYGNTINDLLGVKVDTQSLPADGGAEAFDTVGGSQYISSDQIEQYLKLGRVSIDEAFERRAMQKRQPSTVRIEPEKSIRPGIEKAAKKIEEAQKRFSKWKVEVDKAVARPVNQKRLPELVKKNPQMGHPIHFYKFVELLDGVPPAKKYGFKDAFEATLQHPDWDRSELAIRKHYMTLPHRDKGLYLKLAHGFGRLDIAPKSKKLIPGTYRLRVRLGAADGAPASRRFIEVGHPYSKPIAPHRMALEGAPISQHQVTGTIARPQIIESTFELKATDPKTISVRERQPLDAKALWGAHNRLKAQNGYGHPPSIWIDWVELEGPISEAQVTASKVIRVEPEKTINRKQEKTIRGIEARYAQFTKWQKEVDKAAATPENQAIIAEERKKGRGLDHPRHYYVFAGKLKGAPNPRDFGFIDAAKAAGNHPKVDSANLALYKHFTGLTHRDRGIHLMLAHGIGRVDIKPKELPPGNYTLRVAAAAVPGSPASRHFIEIGHPQRQTASRLWGLEGVPISSHQVTGTIEKPQVIEIPIEVGSQTPKEFGIQEKQPRGDKLKALWKVHNRMKKENGYGIPPAIWIDWVELEGPHAAPASESKSMDWWVNETDAKAEVARVRKILEQFSLLAMRDSQPSAAYIARLVEIFKTRRKAGEKFEIAIRTPLSIILASPGFLYLNEPRGEKQRRKLTDRELAVRLSYFLWSSPPDQTLLGLAKRSELSKPDVLRQQVERMIADSRSDELVSGFVHQWLDMERLDFFQFDSNRHREFDESMRTASRQEVYQSFAHLLRGKGSLGSLLKSDYVMINGLLANYYGIEGVTGDEFRKVKLPADSVRGGLLGMAAIHAMGSDGIESSPVERGAWVLRHILHNPTPPAPPNVPQLSRLADKPLNTRERLAAHMEEPQCASCHRKIDPIGFGMENFDAAGKWRTIERFHSNNKKVKRALKGKKTTWKIDPSGKFHNGPEFSNFQEMRDLIAKWKQDEFARGFTEHLIEYALGRPFGFTDEDLAKGIISSAKNKNYTVSEFFQALVATKEFQSK